MPGGGGRSAFRLGESASRHNESVALNLLACHLSDRMTCDARSMRWCGGTDPTPQNVRPVLGCQSPDANRLAWHLAIKLGCTRRCRSRKSNHCVDRLGGALGGLKSSHGAADGIFHGPSGALFMEVRMIFRAALCGIASMLHSQERMRPHGVRLAERANCARR
jgi:hypothetical protein